MCKLTRENGIWWIGSGENRRRDDDEATQEEEAEDDDEGNKNDFDWEVVIDEATVEGEFGSGEKFYDAEEEARGSQDPHDEIQRSSTKRRDDEIEAPAEDVHEEEVEDQNDFDWEAVIDEVAVQGESGAGEKFYDAKDEIQEPVAVVEEVPAMAA
ncbi:hypothetical protein Dimus_020049 [Dionaea muscipula]